MNLDSEDIPKGFTVAGVVEDADADGLLLLDALANLHHILRRRGGTLNSAQHTGRLKYLTAPSRRLCGRYKLASPLSIAGWQPRARRETAPAGEQTDYVVIRAWSMLHFRPYISLASKPVNSRNSLFA